MFRKGGRLTGEHGVHVPCLRCHYRWPILWQDLRRPRSPPLRGNAGDVPGPAGVAEQRPKQRSLHAQESESEEVVR